MDAMISDRPLAHGKSERGSNDAAQSETAGRRAFVRDKSTRRGVLLGDRIAGGLITAGGLLVILAVIGIMVFLVRVASPLAGGGEVERPVVYTLEAPGPALWVNADEYSTVMTRVSPDGRVAFFHVATGRMLGERQLDFGGATATAVGGVLQRDQVAFGFENGTVRFGTVGFDIGIIPAAQIPGDVQKIDDRDSASDGVVYSRLPGGQARRVAVRSQLGEAQDISKAPIVAVDYRIGGTVERPTRSFVTFDAEGIGRLSRAQTQRNLLTGKETTRINTATLPALPGGTRVRFIAMNSTADLIYAAGDDGSMFRFDARNFNSPTLAETRRAFDDGSQVTAMGFLNGEAALVVGGSRGQVDVFFRLPSESASDGFAMVRARVHEPHKAAVVALDVSQRSKALITQDAGGAVWFRHSTSDQVLARFERNAATGEPSSLMLMPRVDGAMVVAEGGAVDYWRFRFPHPETTLKSIFGKVWYEGYAEETYTWQSSSGTDVFEPKFSLIPLIFGTIKATFYAMLFAVPISLMGAIYTSEFVHRRVRATVKPVMEMMESLPTVVLGFVAALILAPIVEEWIAAVLLAFIAMPLGLLLAAFAWQMLPPQIALRLEGVPKFAMMFAVIGVFLYVSYRSGALFENLLFSGDFKAWTTGRIGSGTPFMFLLLLPLAFIAVRWIFERNWGHRYRDLLRGQSAPLAGLTDFLRFAVFFAASMVLSLAVASALTAIGFDPRGNIVDSYVQRNALVVGFVMGFAIIPNIYTLAEDAMNSVPPHLRSASLAAGATPWQTATWVIIPTAMSGIFAAVMIGMGRAVGETMIVVMAAGNTPVLDWNIFNGLRTLSANIAVELPEAVKDGSLYRMLFLAALTLFVMTFVINTIAEIIRQRFRRRAFQL